MAESPCPTYVLLTDAPPIQEGGHGCHVLAWHWSEAVGRELKLVVTHQLSRLVSPAKVAADLKAPAVFYPDLSRARWPQRLLFLKSLLEAVLFLLWLPGLGRRIRSSGAERLFAFFGGDAWFLVAAAVAAWWTRLPLDVYLVDDLEESARLAGRPGVAWLARWLEPKVLRRAARVFTISPGYVEHLRAKYGVEARWLPVAIPPRPMVHQPYQPSQPDVRTITFIGAVNDLYAGALRDCLREIEEWNREPNAYRLCLLLLTYTDAATVEKHLGRSGSLEVRIRVERSEFEERMRRSWALLLPYSFSEEVRIMVSTSFSTKLVDSFPVGRPVLVYGPPHASVPRYFAENQLPLRAHSPEELKSALRQIAQHDTLALMSQYQATIEKFHAPASVRTILSRIGEAKTHA